MHFQFRQPPLLSAMVQAIYNRTGDLELVKNALPALVKEYQFWNSVTTGDGEANNHILSRYYAMWNKPRPESSTIIFVLRIELDIAFLAKVVGDNAEFIGSFSIKKSNDQIWILE
ncbi:hypothetical protein QYF36_005837 [Acer negundo]|nr:hypothetical protein QYF36_005837 [Acer negundo]